MQIKHYYLYLIFLTGAAINFLPYFLGFSLKDPISGQYPDYLVALSGFSYGASIVASLSTTVPIIFDFILEILLVRLRFETVEMQNPLLSFNIPFGEIVLLLIIPDALFLFWIIPFAQYDLIAPIICSRDIMFTFCFLSLMVKFDNRIWTSWTTVMIGGPLMLANILVSCSTLFLDSTEFQSTTLILTPVLISVGLISLTVTLIRWLYYMKRSNGNNSESDKSRLKNDILCTVFAVLLTIFLYADWILFYFPIPLSSPWSIVGCNYLSMYNYLIAGCTLCVTIVVNRFTRMDAIDTMVKQLIPSLIKCINTSYSNRKFSRLRKCL